MRTTPAGGVAALSPDGGSLALAAADGRLKTFDTASGRLKRTFAGDACVRDDAAAPSTSGNGHLSEEFTCVAWGGSAAKGKGKKKALGGSVLVAVGTRGGDVIAYDVALGELKWRARGANEGGVLSLAFSAADGGHFFSVGEDAAVTALSASTGDAAARFTAGRSALSGVSVVPDQQRVFVGSSGLALWSLDTHKCLCKFTGHPTRVQSLAVSPDGGWGVSCASGERNAVLWRLEESSKKKESTSAGLLNTEEPLVAVSTSPGPGGAFHVTGVTSTGAAYVWLASPAAPGAKAGKARLEGKLLAHVAVEGGAAARGGILTASLQAAGSDTSLLVARGSVVKPSFEHVPLGKGGDEPQRVVLEAADSGVLLDAAASKAKAKAQGGGAANVIGADSLAGADGEAVLRPSVADPAAAPKRKRGGDRGKGTAAAMEVDAAEGAPEPGELTLGERVAALELEQDEAAAVEDKPTAPADGPIKADSLGVLLLQAIRSEDASLLERCLNVSNPALVRNSVARLPPSAAVPLLAALVARLQARPARGGALAAWLRAALTHHAAYLLGAPGASGALTGLYQTLDARLALYRPMLSLAGRLDLLLAQVDTAAGGSGRDVAAALAAGPGTTYELNDSGDEGAVAIEDPFLAGSGQAGIDSSDDEEEEEESDEEGWQTDDEAEEEDSDEEM
eukprot:jgi/Tetstr1/438795/TSEL_027304.t1